jgi:formylglycine-generating enzyme required for sulfatase activity
MKLTPFIFFVFLIFILHFSFCIAFGQEITNCHFEQDGKKVNIYYDIGHAKEGQKFEISLFYSIDGGKTFSGPLQKITGDAGKDVLPGTGKMIVWDVLAEQEKIFSDQVVFEVSAKTMGFENFTETVNGVQIEMVFVKGGTFTMGCTREQGEFCYDSEKPSHSVTLSDFYIGKFEVTQKQWRAVMGSDPAYLTIDSGECPIAKVSWNDVQIFIRTLDSLTEKKYCLPSEAQWEYAARGGNKSMGFKYSGSNIPEDVEWHASTFGKPHPVGQKKPNELGLYDMSGNVWEWCNDWYGAYKLQKQVNPIGPESGLSRVDRGGSWGNYPLDCRSTKRDAENPTWRSDFIGFRLVCIP